MIQIPNLKLIIINKDQEVMKEIMWKNLILY